MKKKKIIYIILIILCMLTIFAFSNKNSIKSDKTSKGLIYNILNTYEKVTNKNINKEKIVKKLNYPVRKIAHYTIYFLLGLFVYKLILLTNWKYKKRKTIGICFLYASLDEIHQLFIAGRTGQVKDVFIDTLGAVSAITLIHFLSKEQKEKGVIK